MTFDEFLSCIKLGGRPISLCRGTDSANTTASEMIEFLKAAYQAGREQTQSELALLIASSQLEVDQRKAGQ